MTEAFELRRRSGRVVYRFVRAAHGAYVRTDTPRMTIRWEGAFGWSARDPDTGALAGRVWDVLPADQGPCPPEGQWVSCKGARSYVYDLVHMAREASE